MTDSLRLVRSVLIADGFAIICAIRIATPLAGSGPIRLRAVMVLVAFWLAILAHTIWTIRVATRLAGCVLAGLTVFILITYWDTLV